MNKSAPQKQKAGGHKKGGVNLGLLLLLIVPLPFLMPTVLILLGLIPTLVALITDDDPNKSRAVCIGSMNFAGVVPFLLDLWFKGHTIDNAIQIICSPNTWLIMLGAAGVGQLILFVVPPMATSFAQNQAVSRVKKLNESVIQLKQIWGPDVATNASLDQVRKQNSGSK